MKTTFDLRHAVCQVIPRRFQIKSLSRVFQAIRIKINDELNILKRTLDLALEFLSPGSRIAIISYHSLEDKLVKSFALPCCSIVTNSILSVLPSPPPKKARMCDAHAFWLGSIF